MAGFLLDHNVHPRLGRLLRERGHAAMTAREAHLDAATDPEILQFTGAYDLVLVTSDEDFVQLHYVGSIPHAGVLLIRPIPYEPRGVALSVANAIEQLIASGTPLANRLFRLTSRAGWEAE